MKIRMRLQILGTRDGVRWPAAGREIELPDHEAARLCANGFAEPVAEMPKAEKAVATEPEKRVRSRKDAS